MYINKIDELIEKIIDDLYLLCLENKSFIKILKEIDYIKFQKEINEMMVGFSRKINFNEIKELVKNNDSTNQIIETIKKYIAFYIFLVIGFFYTEKEDKYINNIVEFSKNQSNYNYKIENFFNSESNALLIKYNYMIHNILTLLSADQAKINKIKTRPDFRETILFLNSLGADFIEDRFKLNKLKNNVNVQAHNIIKTLIIKLIYGTNDKRDFFKILEMSEITDGEYMFINIVLPIKKTIDFSTIENILGNTPHARHLALSIWKYFMEYEENLSKPPMGYDEKILEMINSGIIVPISDDFLLYHKDSEKYDRLEDIEKIKKKEDTKIKYIVNKIDKVRELYSDAVKHDEKLKMEIKKLFYVPLFNRKAILVNIKEDISIINKFINMGKQNIENIDFFKDLEQYKLYPYINFNEFESYGFSLPMTKTVDIVRSVSFSKTGDFKQTVPHSIIQTRIGSKDMIVNIVGFMIPSTITALQCTKIKNVDDIRDLDKNNKNGLEATIKYLKDTGMNLERNKKSKVWFFNEELDTFELRSYEQISKFSMQDKIKHMVSELYDKIQDRVSDAILNTLSSDKDLTLQRGYAIIEDYKEILIDIAKDSDVYTDVENNLFNLIVAMNPEYDINEDKVYDITDVAKESKKINVKKQNKGISTLKINLSSIDEYGEIVKKPTISGICQHNISKERIDSIDKKDFIKYSDQLYKFIQQYVTVNIHNEYICKSCGYSLDISQYIEDGEYDDETRTFVSYSTPIDISLEDVIGYEKFKIAIRQIDKIIEKIAVVSNLLHLARGSIDVKSKRKLIIKNTIDLLLANNKKLGKIYKDRKTNINKLYGINPNNSELWIFDLTNDIFVFSSRDIDKYKPLKINNIIAYSIFFILLEINQSHVQFMGDDKKKICNFVIFDRIMDSLFGGLKIIVNNKGDISNITNFKILCYMIYIISCTITSQTKMWHYKFPEGENKKKFVPMIQRSLIHTVIDVMNSVLEIGKDEPNHPLYGMNTSRFFKKLQDIYQDEELYLKLKKDTMTSSTTERKDAILLHQGYIKLSGKYTPITFAIPERRLCNAATLRIDILPPKYKKYYGISNLSNCPDGRYHEWVTRKEEKQMICKLCKVVGNETDYDKDLSNDIKKKFKGILNKELAENICEVDGLPHIFGISETGEEICQKCGRNKNHKYTSEESEKVKNIVEKNNKKKEDDLIKFEQSITEKSKKNQDYVKGVIKKLSEEFKKENKEKDMDFMYKLTDEIQKVIGKELNDVNLTENMYIIDHDHLGNPLSNSIKILESQGKIEEKLNHPYFKTDVLFYSNKQKKIDVFYDAHTKILLGYKEESKNYVLNKKHDRTIKLIYSLINKLKLIGYKSQFIPVEIDEIGRYASSSVDGRVATPLNGKNSEKSSDSSTLLASDEQKDLIKEEIIKSVIQDRLLQLKKVLLYLKIVLSRIINNHSEEITPDDYYKVKINALIEQYSKKRMDPVMSDANGNNLVFKHWKAVTNGITGDSLEDIKLNFDFSEKKTVYYNKINEIDNAGNMLTYYIIRELVKLFEFNEKNKALTTTISHFIVDFFNTIFNIVNEEKENDNIDVKRFKYILESSTHVKEIEERSSIKILEGIVTEYVDSDEKSKEEIEAETQEREDNVEEAEALDVDVDPDDAGEAGEDREIDYDHGARGYEGDL